MREVKPEEMVVSQLYYIQSPLLNGNGKQKGFFVSLDKPYEFTFARFEKVEDISSVKKSGYANGNRMFRCEQCRFYLPEKEAIVERVMMNAVLREITGDPSFFYYTAEKSYPRGKTILVNNWLNDSKK
jgi:hypothetical protein